MELEKKELEIFVVDVIVPMVNFLKSLELEIDPNNVCTYLKVVSTISHRIHTTCEKFQGYLSDDCKEQITRELLRKANCTNSSRKRYKC